VTKCNAIQHNVAMVKHWQVSMKLDNSSPLFHDSSKIKDEKKLFAAINVGRLKATFGFPLVSFIRISLNTIDKFPE